MESWFLAGSHPKNYELAIDMIMAYQGKNSGSIQSVVAQPEGFGTVMQMFRANAYRGKRLRFSAVVRSEAVDEEAALWMRVDGPHEYPLSFDNMQNRPIKGTTDWQRYDVVLDVPQASVHIAFGLLLAGKGQAWFSDIHFEEVGMEIPVTQSAPDYPDAPANLDFAH